MHLSDYSELAIHCREQGFGFDEFRKQPIVGRLHWPDDVTEQWIYDLANHVPFLTDYRDVDLSTIMWRVEALPVGVYMRIATGPSESDTIEEFARDPDHWVAVRKHGVHRGVGLSWEVHGTWKRWPLIIERDVLNSGDSGLQLVEGRTRVGVLRGRHRQGKLVADRHLVWVGRRRS